MSGNFFSFCSVFFGVSCLIVNKSNHYNLLYFFKSATIIAICLTTSIKYNILIFSLLGDIFLMFDNLFLLGELMFLINNGINCWLIFSTLYNKHEYTFNNWITLYTTVILFALNIVILNLISSTSKKWSRINIIYAFFLSLMVLLGINYSSMSRATNFLGVGTTMFMISDILIALDKFYYPIKNVYWIALPLYWIGQYLILNNYIY